MGGMNREIRIDIYALLILRIKQITDETILYSRGDSTCCSVLPRERSGGLTSPWAGRVGHPRKGLTTLQIFAGNSCEL